MREITVLGKGPTSYWRKIEFGDSEVWGCNDIYLRHKVDRLFIMHPLWKTYGDTPDFAKLNALEVPVYSAFPIPQVERNVVYPLGDVLKEFNTGFFLNVLCYMLALAIKEGPDVIRTVGVDMLSKHEYLRGEKGCVEFWMGVAVGRGIKLTIPKESETLRRPNQSNFYGYDCGRNHERKETSAIAI